MDNKKGIAATFWLGCIPARLLVAKLVLEIPRLGLLCLVPAVVFGYLAFAPKVRPLGAFGQPAWWEPWRAVHALLWGAAGVATAFERRQIACAAIVIDTAIGGALKAMRG